MTTPEKIVERDVLKWAHRQGWSLDVYDSKAVFSAALGRYKQSRSLRDGTSDLLGCDRVGHFVAIELKAPGKETVCRLKQWTFLRKKIEHGGFAVVVKSSEQLSLYYEGWLEARKCSFENSQKYLVELLPKKVLVIIGKKKVVVSSSSIPS